MPARALPRLLGSPTDGPAWLEGLRNSARWAPTSTAPSPKAGIGGLYAVVPMPEMVELLVELDMGKAGVTPDSSCICLALFDSVGTPENGVDDAE